MKEDFLHHVWQHKKFAVTHLKTTTGESIQILNSGQLLQLAGPDFFNAQLIIGNQKWAGNIEIPPIGICTTTKKTQPMIL